MGVIQSLTIEASFGAVKAGTNTGLLYDEVLWKKVGSDLALGLYHFLIPTLSPVYNYVNKELIYFEPKTSKEAKKLREMRKLNRKKSNLSIKNENECGLLLNEFTNKIKTNILEQLQRQNIPDQGFLKVQRSNTFFSCNIKDIKTTQPALVTPRWNQTYFKKNH